MPSPALVLAQKFNHFVFARPSLQANQNELRSLGFTMHVCACLGEWWWMYMGLCEFSFQEGELQRLVFRYKNSGLLGTWVSQLVECSLSAQVMIPCSWDEVLHWDPG